MGGSGLHTVLCPFSLKQLRLVRPGNSTARVSRPAVSCQTRPEPVFTSTLFKPRTRLASTPFTFTQRRPFTLRARTRVCVPSLFVTLFFAIAVLWRTRR
eukprot:1071582-Pyramimonas_sp.AAC.1